MSWSVEEYLIYTLDFFEDYTGHLLLLGYDLRIDVYGDYRVGPLKNYDLVQPGQILKITKQFKKDELLKSEEQIKYDLEIIKEKKLNTIEDVHLQKFKNYHPKRLKESAEKTFDDAPIRICVGTVEAIKTYSSVIFEKSFELLVKYNAQTLTLLTRDENYKIGDQVCFLTKNTDNHSTVLGLKPRALVQEYLQQDYLQTKNIEANFIEFR